MSEQMRVVGQVEVWHQHQIVGIYPRGTVGQVMDDQALEIGRDRFEAGDWSAWGSGINCAFIDPDPDCPRCVRPPER